MAFSSDQPMVSNQLQISMDYPENPEDLRTALTDSYKKIANVMNTKVGGLYNPTEVATYKLLAAPSPLQPNRNVYRKTLDLVTLNGGNIGAGAVVAFPHGISSVTNTLIIYASCTSTSSVFFTVVYPNVFLDATLVHFTNPLAATLSQCNVICEITKN